MSPLQSHSKGLLEIKLLMLSYRNEEEGDERLTLLLLSEKS